MPEKVFRLFASIDKNDKELMKVRDGSASRIGYTPDRCFIVNDDVRDMSVPSKLDYWWYLDLADKRINDFLGYEG
jgi:hypothetical protein